MTCENVIRGFENVPYSWWSGSSQNCCKCRKPDETITDTWVTGWKLIWATLSPSTCPVSRMEDLAVVNTPKGLVQASPHWLQRLGVSYHILYWRSSTRTSFSCFDLSFSKLGFIYNSKRYQPNKQWRRSWNCWPKFLYEIIDNNIKRCWKGENNSFKKWIIILFSLFS